jgi:hypothetical protein
MRKELALNLLTNPESQFEVVDAIAEVRLKRDSQKISAAYLKKNELL